MLVTINGRSIEVGDDATLIAGLLAFGIEPARRGIAVAINGEVAPRSTWEETRLTPGANLEIVMAKQGG